MSKWRNGQIGGDQYIRNQNLLSDWEDITISTDSNNPTVMQNYDGILAVTIVTPGQRVGNVYVNNVLISTESGVVTTSEWSGTHSITIPFKKGDRIYEAGANDVKGMVCYYKLRDYKGR